MTTQRRFGQALQRLVGGGLATRFVAMSLLLLLFVQAAGFGFVRASIDHNGRAQLDSELEVGQRIWQRQLETHAQRLRQGALLLAADYGLRAAIGSGDVATIGSALENHGARMGASVAALLDNQFVARAVHAGQADATRLMPLLHDVAESLARSGSGSGLGIADGQALQFVAVPLRTPMPVGWVVLGFPLGQALADDMRALSGLHVALLVEADATPVRGVASTLDGEAIHALLRDGLTADGDLLLNGDELHARRLTHPAAGGMLHAVLLRSVAEVVAPFRQLQFVLAAITVLGLALFAVGSIWAALRVTTPLRSLALASERLAQGDYELPMQATDRRDEIGDLARAYDRMRLGIAANEAEMWRLAYCDRLTDMPNRARFRDAVHDAIGQARSAAGSVAILVLDLNRFKLVNDLLGYALGDRLLKVVAERLASDVARGGDTVARLGSDEFALLLPGAGVDTAMLVAARLAASFERPLILDRQMLDLSAGVGIACWPAHAADADNLLMRAEVAMHSAKRGSDAAVVYDPAMDNTSAQTLSLLSELRDALEGGELRLFLQPKVGLADGRLVGAEALLRWQHPQRGLLSPVHFVPFAEQAGFVRHLTLWIFDQAARHWLALQAGGDLRISVNLSTRDLLDLELPDKLGAILARHQVQAAGFCLEITESAMMDDPARAQAVLLALSARGFKLSIDDFGTGYSSLSYLQRLPVDELKIDRSFVAAMERNPDDATIVRSTIDLAHNLGLKVVAEGIETADAMTMLARLGCDEGQGYHMSRPLPVAEFGAWAQRWQGEPRTTATVRAAEAVA